MDSHFKAVLAEFEQLKMDAEKAKAEADQTIADADAGIRAIRVAMKKVLHREDNEESSGLFNDYDVPTDILPPEPATSMVLKLLQKSPYKTFTVAEIAKGISDGVSSKTLHGALWRLSKESKKINNVGRGKYKLRPSQIQREGETPKTDSNTLV